MEAEKSRNSIIASNHCKISSSRKRKWKTEIEQQIYSSKLAEALRRRSPINGRSVRQTADSVLAAAAKGRTRWSRAILASRFLQRRRRTKKLICREPPRAAETKNERIRKLPAVERKVKFLRQLVPGCRNVSLPNLVEETTDYISALEMQVKAMTALVELLAGTQSNLNGISNNS